MKENKINEKEYDKNIWFVLTFPPFKKFELAFEKILIDKKEVNNYVKESMIGKVIDEKKGVVLYAKDSEGNTMQTWKPFPPNCTTDNLKREFLTDLAKVYKKYGCLVESNVEI